MTINEHTVFTINPILKRPSEHTINPMLKCPNQHTINPMLKRPSIDQLFNYY